MLDSSEYQLMKYFPVMLCQNIVSQNKIQWKKIKSLMVYFIFPFYWWLKKVVTFSLFQVCDNFISNISYH